MGERGTHRGTHRDRENNRETETKTEKQTERERDPRGRHKNHGENVRMFTLSESAGKMARAAA